VVEVDERRDGRAGRLASWPSLCDASEPRSASSYRHVAGQCDLDAVALLHPALLGGIEIDANVQLVRGGAQHRCARTGRPAKLAADGGNPDSLGEEGGVPGRELTRHGKATLGLEHPERLLRVGGEGPPARVD